MTKNYMTAVEVEQEMQIARDEEGFSGNTEKLTIKNIVQGAKRSSNVGDKCLLVINPVYIHVPEWQRTICISKALKIGTNYNKYKWETPKVLYNKNKLWVIDGQHRIYGAFKSGMDSVVVEIIECSEEEAIDLFLSQTKDRNRMRPIDMYNASVAAGHEEYVVFKEICHKHNIAITGEDLNNAVGLFSSITDGVKMAHENPDLFDRILTLLGDLHWNADTKGRFGRAYRSAVFRAVKKMYAYYEGRETEMEEILLNKCSGANFYGDKIKHIYHTATIFDLLSSIVRHEMGNPIKNNQSIKIAS